MIRPALLLVLVVASSSAQEKQAPPRTAAAFVPKGHGCEVQIDLARLRAMRLWSDLAGAPPLRKLQQGGEEALL